MKKLLRIIKRFFDKFFGTTTDRIYWKGYYLLAKEDKGENLSHPYKDVFLKEVLGTAPFGTMFEIGCGAGFNLHQLAKKFLDKKFYGIDISGKAIQHGKEFLKKEKISNVFLEKSAIENLSGFTDKSMDIVFSYAAIMYIGPDSIARAVKEMLRVAKKTIILCEYHADLKPFYNDHWIYNYKELFKDYVKEDSIKIIKLPQGESSGDWAKFGHIIKIELK